MTPDWNTSRTPASFLKSGTATKETHCHPLTLDIRSASSRPSTLPSPSQRTQTHEFGQEIITGQEIIPINQNFVHI